MLEVSGRAETTFPSPLTLSVSLIVPIFNEQDILELFMRRTVDDLTATAGTFEIIAVDDGSTDSTPEILARLVVQFPQIRIVRMPTNRGIGLATVEGIAAAACDIVGWNTVDRVIDTKACVARAIEGFAAGYDVVSFYRSDLSGSSLYQRILTRGNQWLIRFLFPWKIRAYQQFQFHRRQFAQSVVFESKSHFVSPELLFKACHVGMKLLQIETDYFPRVGGQPKGGRLRWVLQTAVDILKIWFLWFVLRRPPAFK